MTWPVRLWIVEPLGETGNWSPGHSPYRLLSHQIRVLEETDAHRALGAAGRDVLDVIQQRLPDRAVRWAEDRDDGPEGMRRRCRAWEKCGARTRASGERADASASEMAHARRESAAQFWAERLGRRAVDQALVGAGASKDAHSYACDRAMGLVLAAQHQARYDPYTLDALRGVDRVPA
ncbi:hypothetical protein ACLQ17_25685 [Streptomyces sp. DT197]|uniref:hypothetical protein n=1 Tax=Streptomyces sp. DT197 TaxID=3393417 RepID=UPI003698409A